MGGKSKIGKSAIMAVAIAYNTAIFSAATVQLSGFAQYGLANINTIYNINSPTSLDGDLSVGDQSRHPTLAFGGSAGVFWKAYDLGWGSLAAGPTLGVMGASIACPTESCEAQEVGHYNVYFGIGYLSIPLRPGLELYTQPSIGYASGTIDGYYDLDGQIEFDGISYGLRTGVAYTVNERFKINAGFAFWLLDVHAPPEDPDVGEFESPTTANVEQPFHIHEFLLELGVTAMFPQ